jgi:hypothetical protein
MGGGPDRYGQRGARILTLSIIAADGKEVWKKEIGEKETVDRWTNTANEKQTAAVNGFAAAKAAGYYGESDKS